MRLAAAIVLLAGPCCAQFKSTGRRTTTGGRSLNFLKKSALEHAIELVSDEVHRQYIFEL
jgi:hypothetical protein